MVTKMPYLWSVAFSQTPTWETYNERENERSRFDIQFVQITSPCPSKAYCADCIIQINYPQCKLGKRQRGSAFDVEAVICGRFATYGKWRRE